MCYRLNTCSMIWVLDGSSAGDHGGPLPAGHGAMVTGPRCHGRLATRGHGRSVTGRELQLGTRLARGWHAARGIGAWHGWHWTARG